MSGASDDRSVKLWWAVPAAAFVVLIALALLFGRTPEPIAHGTSYDASSRGFRAAYLLLEELDYPVFRSRRLRGGSVRWLLYPTAGTKEAPNLAAWVRGGGLLLLADNSKEFARHLGMSLEIRANADRGEQAASGLGVARLAGGSMFVRWPGQPGHVVVEAGGEPVVTVHSFGQGEVWLVNRPELMSNRLLRRADNAVLVCRLASEMLHRRPEQLGFDEYFHGLRDRPGVTELLLKPPTLWVTLHGLLLLSLLLWHYAPRFGALRPLSSPSRRSKEEFLDAMASLLERKKDYAAGFATVRDGLVRELERELGLPAGATVEQVVAEAGRRRRSASGDTGRLHRLLTAEALPPGAGVHAFLHALNELEAARNEFFSGRPHR